MNRQEILRRVKTPTAAEPVVIGHRGLKMNLAPDELVRENTLHSFHSGIAAGATFVEFDVQVTADGVPVLWHDDDIVTMDAADKPSCRPVASVTVAEFKLLTSGAEVPFRGERVQLARVFKGAGQAAHLQRWTCGGAANAFGGTPATLAEVLAFTPAHVGFDIELKFDSRTISTPEERRRHLEATYAEVGAVADQRVLFFSSFDPSACVDMRAMQDEYPVLMLTCMDETSADHRQRSFLDAVHVVVAHDLDGVVANNELLFHEEQHVERLSAAGKCLLTYGSGNTDPETILRQVALGITGLCTDDLGLCNATLVAQRVLQRVVSMPAMSSAASLDDREHQPLSTATPVMTIPTSFPTSSAAISIPMGVSQPPMVSVSVS